MDKENPTAPQDEEIAVALESCECIEKYSGKLKLGLLKLQHLSEAISEHLMHGDAADKQQTSQLWHDLNNIEHQIKQFTCYAEKSVRDIASTSEKFIENLRSLRPSKPRE